MLLSEKLKHIIAQAAQVEPERIALEHPELAEHGDFATNVALALKGGRQLANELAPKIKGDMIAKVEVAGPGFINIWIKPEYLLSTLDQALEMPTLGTGQTWLIEHTSPNPNKAMHLGHLRNNVTGMAIANLWEACGITVIRDDIDNNRGIAIAKLMWGYLKFGKNETLDTLKMRPDRFVDELYVKASEEFDKSEDVQKEIRQLVVDWEAGDQKTWDLWQKVLEFSYRGQAMTLERLGNKWDKVWHEHEHYQQGKDFVEAGLKKGIFRKTDKGTIITNLEEYGLPDTVVIKSDGTALYITQDLALTKLKVDTFHPDKLFWVIGPEQSLALQQFFAVCEQLGIGKREDYAHLAYGYMSIKGKGKMSSRTGNVIYIDDLLDSAVAKASTLNPDPAIAEKVGVGAVKYSILKLSRLQDMAFDIEESVSLQGNSGPYLQYTYARAQSILKKGAAFTAPETDLNPDELAILRFLYRYPEIVAEAASRYAPNLLTNFLYELAQRFNTFYNSSPILGNEVRITLTKTTAEVLQSGLQLLGIASLEHM